MMQKDKKLVIVFLVILFGICLCIPCKFVLVKIGVMSMNMDNFLEYKEKDVNNVVDKINNVVGRIENSVENKVTNYFPFYNVINSLYDQVDFTSNKILFKDVPIKKNSDGEYIFYDKVNEFYYLTNKYTSKELDERLDSQVKFFNELSKKKIDVNIYIPTRYEFTTLKKDNLSNYVGEFVSKLDSNINVRVMDVKSIDEYKEYFYKTDHHWTIKGALDGYKDICDMLNIDAINNLNIVKHKERMYYGSLAKTALNDNINDYISDVDIKLDYDVYVNGKSADSLFKPREIRLDRSYKYYDYYVQYFNGQYGNVVYDYHNSDKENLLIIGDSYSWQIDYLIASSFNKTHVINLRYDEYKNKKFNLSKYVSDNNISKVLFLYEGGSSMFDQYDYDFEGRVK